MNKIKHAALILIVLVYSSLLIPGCQKGFLDAKPSSSIIQTNTLKDFRAILENFLIYNSTGALPQLSSDEFYYLNDSAWQAALTATERQSYIWDKDVYGGEVNIQDWNTPYQDIFYANSVLDGLSKVTTDSIGNSDYNFIKGWAYFVRAYEMYDLLKNFAPAYDSATASKDLGIPLKLRSGIDNIEPRASVQACFDQVQTDCKQALALLPTQYPTGNANHPSKIAAFALLARVNLYMRRYREAALNADSSLSLYNILIDYNTITSTSNYPFPNQTIESVYTTSQITKYSSTLVGNNSKLLSVDSNLLKTYAAGDLRVSVFFKSGSHGNIIMRGGYYGAGLYPYSGLAVDELYLIRAEANARLGNSNIAIEDLNTLLKMRFIPGYFHPLDPNGKYDLVSLILAERRKELVWRGIRWSDLKRLNKDGANITLTRILGNKTFTLSPNDKRYVFNIPQDEITLSGIQQNER